MAVPNESRAKPQLAYRTSAPLLWPPYRTSFPIDAVPACLVGGRWYDAANDERARPAGPRSA